MDVRSVQPNQPQRASQTPCRKRGGTIDPDVPAVPADMRMLTQVLNNLLTNATAYTPHGGTITVRTRTQAAEGQTWATFAVEDTGPGISREEQAHLFERFFRGQAARAGNVSGTGLGLAICHEIIKRHQGRITVESQLGQGSTFTVWLPVIM